MKLLSLITALFLLSGLAIQAAEEFAPCEFKGRIQGKDGMQFQIGVKGKSALLKIGDKVGPWTITSYKEKVKEPVYQSPTRLDVPVDESELILSRPGPNSDKPEEVKLILRQKINLRW